MFAEGKTLPGHWPCIYCDKLGIGIDAEPCASCCSIHSSFKKLFVPHHYSCQQAFLNGRFTANQIILLAAHFSQTNTPLLSVEVTNSERLVFSDELP